MGLPQGDEAVEGAAAVRPAVHDVAEEHQQVGGRRGAPVLLRIEAAAMDHAGLTFTRSDNGVWLTDHVPIAYLSIEAASVNLP